MTDEGARKIVKQELQVDEDYGDMHVETILVKAGYRAALEEARQDIQKRRLLALKENGSPYKVISAHEDWLEQQVKK